MSYFADLVFNKNKKKTLMSSIFINCEVLNIK